MSRASALRDARLFKCPGLVLLVCFAIVEESNQFFVAPVSGTTLLFDVLEYHHPRLAPATVEQHVRCGDTCGCGCVLLVTNLHEGSDRLLGLSASEINQRLDGLGATTGVAGLAGFETSAFPSCSMPVLRQWIGVPIPNPHQVCVCP